MHCCNLCCCLLLASLTFACVPAVARNPSIADAPLILDVLTVAGLPTFAGDPCVIGVPAVVAFVSAVAGLPAVAGVPAIAGVPAVARVTSDPGIHILAGVFTNSMYKHILGYGNMGLRLPESGLLFFLLSEWANSRN